MTMTADSHSVYRACIKEAAAQGAGLMQRAIRGAVQGAAERAQRAPDASERPLVHEAVDLLVRHERALCEAYPPALLAEFAQAISGSAPRAGGAALSFAQLELVDDEQVQESVEVVRTQQAVLSAVEHELVQLNALVCAAQGFRTVQADRNPLRPDAYVRSLRSVIQASAVAPRVRRRWLQFLGEALGPELARSYVELSGFLRGQGVSEAGFQVVPAAPSRTAEPARAPAQEVSTLLTVRGLQRLLAGEPEARPATRPAAPPSEPGTDFAETLPAAAEVLQEMRSVDSVLQRMRRRELAGGAGSVREAMRAEVHRPGQAVALEVVGLMVENIAGDARLLPSVRDAVRALEPALLRLAIADPRFFSDRRHPARRFLDEITTRSLAWQAEDEPGWAAFIGPLREAVDALAGTRVSGPEPYEFALQTLDETWTRGQSRERRQREKAVRTLLQAEQRNLLAARLAGEIEGRNDLHLAPPEVVAFLLGPWVQVMAAAQLADTEGRDDPGGYRAAVPELLRSVLPHTTPAAVQALGRRLPALLETLQQGMKQIGYAQVQVRRFFDRLAQLHQRAMKGLAPEPLQGDAREALAQLLGPMPAEGDGWLVPAEAQQTGFMESQPGTGAPMFQATEPGRASTAPAPLPQPDPDLPLQTLQPGNWVELQLEGGWSRWQLSWVSPHRTLLMFTGASGQTQSMTPRLAAGMAQAGTLRLVSSQAVVDGALDAVADAALRNSLELPGQG